jgi:hypothetical protein
MALHLTLLKFLEFSYHWISKTGSLYQKARSYCSSTFNEITKVSRSHGKTKRAAITVGKFILLTFILKSCETLSQECSQTPFPKFLGGYTGNTYFTSIDYHSGTSQLVAGGITTDSSITNQVNFWFPIIVSYQGAFFAYYWGSYGPTSSYNEVTSLSISLDGSAVLAQVDNGKILVLSAKDGTLTRQITLA